MSSIKQDSYIAIVDCNNFYASCERVFNPALNNNPVIVLSNNDGCVIARSQEVKDLGIPMGIPVFKIKHLVEIHDIQIFSSNFALYGDISNRIMNIIRSGNSEMEVYSIDEAFVTINPRYTDPIDYATKLRDKIYQWTGSSPLIDLIPKFCSIIYRICIARINSDKRFINRIYLHLRVT